MLICRFLDIHELFVKKIRILLKIVENILLIKIIIILKKNLELCIDDVIEANLFSIKNNSKKYKFII